MDRRQAAAHEICAVLQNAGHRALLAGGCVRDLLLGEAPQDYDIATSARVNDISMLFPRTVPVGAAFGVLLVLHPEEGPFEVATFRKDGPYLDGRHPSSVTFSDEIEDARRRDFTINALFLDPATGTVLDYVEGRADIEARVLRTVGDARQRFEEDYLRLLRAVRFAARLGYTIAPETFDAMRACAVGIHHVSAERISGEMLKILTEGSAKRGFELLDASGLLHEVLPEVEAMKGVEQPPNFHPEGDVFIHTLLMLSFLPKGCQPTLALGTLLHDVGKPPTQTFEDRIRFNFHHKVGARMAEAICRRWRLPTEQTKRVVWLVEQHMRTADIPEMRESKRKRFVREYGFMELLELCRLDCLGSHGQLDIIEWIEEYIGQLAPDAVRPKPLLSGNDLIQMGYTPGPRFKEILTAVEDAQLEGTLGTSKEARCFVREHYPHQV